MWSCGQSSPRFGGVTTYMRAPARGVWKDDTGETTRDDIVIFEVMIEDLDREWWGGFRKELERRFRQESVIVRALLSTGSDDRPLVIVGPCASAARQRSVSMP